MILSAYAQLRPVERVFVDGFVQRIIIDAVENKDRIGNALYRPLTDEVLAQYGDMLSRPMVMAAITEQIKDRAAETELAPHRVLKEIRSIAFSNVTDVMELGEDGWFYGFKPGQCSREQLAAIQSIEYEENGPKRKWKIRYHNKLEALKMAANMMGLLEPDNPHYRAETARPVNAQLASGVSDQEAMEAFQRLANNSDGDDR